MLGGYIGQFKDRHCARHWPDLRNPAARSSGCWRGSWMVSRMSFFTLTRPPTSSHVTLGIWHREVTTVIHTDQNLWTTSHSHKPVHTFQKYTRGHTTSWKTLHVIEMVTKMAGWPLRSGSTVNHLQATMDIWQEGLWPRGLKGQVQG